MNRKIFTIKGIALGIAIIALTALMLTISGSRSEASAHDDIDRINALLDEFEDTYSNKRVNDVRQLFYANSVIAIDLDGGQNQRVVGLEDWLQATEQTIFKLNENISDRLTNREIVVLRNIAYVVCNYTYIDDTHKAQGMDVFTLLKTRDRWRIVSLQWTGDTVETY